MKKFSYILLFNGLFLLTEVSFAGEKYIEPPFNWRDGVAVDDIDDFLFMHEVLKTLQRTDNPAYHANLALFNTDLSGNDWLEHGKIAVGLGYNCTVAIQLSNERLRHRAFPFDWCESTIDGVIKCIKDDFKDFLLLKNLRPDNHVRVTDILYGITIVHDFPFQQILDFDYSKVKELYGLESSTELIRKQYAEMHEKFIRRIERFKKTASFGGKIYFIRCGSITKEESINLLNVLNEKFEKNDFVLVVINNTNQFKIPWNIPKLKNFYLPEFCHDKGLLTKIFKSVGLIE